MERRTFRVSVVVLGVLVISMLMSICTYANTKAILYSNTDLTQMTGMSKEEFVAYCAGMQNDKTGFYQRNASYIYECCKKYGFNEMGFIGISAWEGGWCQYGISYNYYGLGTFCYNSEREGIDHFIRYLTSNYLNKNGMYYSGTTIKDVNIHYNSINPEWYWSVIECANSSQRRG